MSGKYIYITYDDDHTLLESAKKMVEKGVYIRDVFSPFPIHGLDPVIGLKRTRIAIAGFIYGMLGVFLAILGTWYFMIQDWPLNIGGKPNNQWFENMPAFIPIVFEFGVLCSAHLMAITYLFRNKIFPGAKAKNPYPRTTDDWFVIEVHEGDSDVSLDEVKSIAQATGSINIEDKNT